MATSRSGAGGKIVTNRRQQRLSTTPYDRPPSQPSLPERPNWFTGVIIPSARTLASGAGKILSSIFLESESSSSEYGGYDSEDDVHEYNDYEVPYDRVNKSNERTETKQIIEQLIMQETFAREECDRLIGILNSRVLDWSVIAGKKSSIAGSPGKMVEHEDVDIYVKAVQEAKKWFEEKKAGSSSEPELACGTSNLYSTWPEQVEGEGSPVDVARSYMKERPPWASPTRNFELRAPLSTNIKLLNEATPSSVGLDTSSSSKKRNSLASGMWNIQEELRRVRSKATDDVMLSPFSKIDPSSFSVASSREKSLGAGTAVFLVSEPEYLMKIMPRDATVDADVNSDPALAAFAFRQDIKASDALSSRPVREDVEAVQEDGELTMSKLPRPPSTNHVKEQPDDPHLSKISRPSATEVTGFSGENNVNGISSAQASLPAGAATVQNNKKHSEENHVADNASEDRSAKTSNIQGSCELLSETYVEVPIVTEKDSVASGSPSSLTVPSSKEKVDTMARKQQRRNLGNYNRRSKGRGK